MERDFWVRVKLEEGLVGDTSRVRSMTRSGEDLGATEDLETKAGEWTTKKKGR